MAKATLAQLRAAVLSLLYEPTTGRRYTSTEVDRWINEAIKEIARKSGFQKKRATLNSGNIAFTRDSLAYYRLPTDFIALDPNYGVHINGLARWPTTESQVDMFSEWYAANAPSGITSYVDRYFRESFTGLIAHYGIEYNDSDEMAAAAPGPYSGKIIFFIPNPAATDTIAYEYIQLPTLLSGTSATTLDEWFDEAIIYGAVERALFKAFNGGAVSEAVYKNAERLSEKKLGEAVEFFEDLNKTKQLVPRIRSARQAYDMYNSAHQRRTSGSGIE